MGEINFSCFFRLETTKANWKILNLSDDDFRRDSFAIRWRERERERERETVVVVEKKVRSLYCLSILD